MTPTARSFAPFCLLLMAAACGRPAEQGGTRGGRTVIQNKGSDTLVNVAQAWAEAYKTVAPTVAVAVSGGGSGTGISALLNGTVDLANSSRDLKDKELEQARAKGIEPQKFVVGYDALAIYLHAANPIKEISRAQLAAIYGEGGAIETWSQLGVTVPGCGSDEIVRVSRQNNSGTYEYFKEAVLGEGGEYKLGSRDLHGSKDVVDLVEHTPCAIGYSGIAYSTPGVNKPCVRIDEAGACIVPTVASAVDGTYPIARPLFMFTQGAPTGAVRAYLDWILSDAGQCLISDKGYAPVRHVECG